MEEAITIILQNVPNLAGLVILAVALWKLVNRLMDENSQRLTIIENRLDALDLRIEAVMHQVNSSAVPPRSGGIGVLSDRRKH